MNKNNPNLTLQNVITNITIVKNIETVDTHQFFHNNEDEAININYEFPLPSKATIYSFEIKIEKETFKGISKEKYEAMRILEQAIKDGDTASVVKKHDNMFTFIINNVPANANFEVIIKYLSAVTAKNEVNTVSIPTTLAGKYNTPQPEEYMETEFLKKELATAKNTVNIQIYNAKNVKITSDHGGIIKNKDDITSINFKNIISNRDIWVEYQTDDKNFIIKSNKNYRIMNMLSYFSETTEDSLEDKPAKNYVFIMDNSGSMAGIKLENAKNALKLCIRNITDKDTFNVVMFNNNYNALSGNLLKINDENINKADHFIDETIAIGGTEIANVLEEYLYCKDLTVMLFTDGQVYDTEEVYETIRYKDDSTRLFCMGIDDAIDEGFINKMAELGNGRSDFMNSSTDIYEKTINQLLCTYENPETILITTKESEIERKLYPGDSISLTINEKIKSVKQIIDNKEIDIPIKTINDNQLFELLNVQYFYELINRKNINYKRRTKYAIDANILTNDVCYVLVKENEEKIHSNKTIEISGMSPTGWLQDSMLKSSANFFANSSVNEICRGLSMMDAISNGPVTRMGLLYSKSLKSTPQPQIISTSNQTVINPLEEMRLNKELLIELFTKQIQDGSIDGDNELTIKAVKLYEKNKNDYKFLQNQYKKAVKYLKKNKIKY